jgi:hypothetical protein
VWGAIKKKSEFQQFRTKTGYGTANGDSAREEDIS